MREYIPYISSLIDGVVNGLSFLLPEFVLTLAFLCSIFSGVFLKGKSFITWWIAFIGIATAGILTSLQISSPATETSLFGMILPDVQGLYLKLLVGFVCLLFCVFVYYNRSLQDHQKKIDDLLSILLVIHIGLNFTLIAVNWLLVYLAIEMISVGSYILVAYLSKDNKQSEAALKYVLFGTACSAMMLYGLSLFYGYTGSLCFIEPVHLKGLLEMPPLVFTVALLFVMTGIGFKLSFVPFHFWSPDVYQGAPTPITAFLSTAPKIAVIGLLARFVLAWPTVLRIELPPLIFYCLAGAAIASMLLGNLAAVRQRNIKRMMAYSSIGHTGFLLMIILVGTNQAFTVLFYFLAIYVIMNMGVFMLADYLEEKLNLTTVEHYQGTGKLYPITMTALTVLMVSLVGLPPTAGFMAKLLSFSVVFNAYERQEDVVWLLLLIVGAFTTVVALFFYFKIPLNAFLRSAKQELPELPFSGLWVMALLLSVLVLLLGIYPSLLLHLI